MERRCGFHVEDAPQVFRLIAKDEPIDADAGIVHQNVQPPNFLATPSPPWRTLLDPRRRETARARSAAAGPGEKRPAVTAAQERKSLRLRRARSDWLLSFAVSGKSGTPRTSTSIVC